MVFEGLNIYPEVEAALMIYVDWKRITNRGEWRPAGKHRIHSIGIKYGAAAGLVEPIAAFVVSIPVERVIRNQTVGQKGGLLSLGCPWKQ